MGKIIVEGASIGEILAMLQKTGLGNSGASALVNNHASEEGDEDDAGPVNTSAPSVDSDGLPWDARIHSDKKGTTQDGKWRKRRNVNADLVKTVEAELRAAGVQQPQTMQQPIQAAAMGMPMGMTGGPVSMPAGDAGMPQTMQQPVQSAPMGGMPQQTMPQQSATGVPDFGNFMATFSAGMKQQGADGQPLIGQQYLGQLVSWLGVGDITGLATRPDLIEKAIGQLRTDGKWLGA